MDSSHPTKSNIPKAQDLFDVVASKSQEQQIKIIEAAIESFAKNGIEKTTYTHLAKVCKISRPLINHYFPTLEDLFLLTAKYVRRTLLNMALKEMWKGGPGSRDQLRAYFKGCFNWVEKYPEQCSFWLLYFYQTSLKGKARDENTALVKAGHERIQGILMKGTAEKEWKVKDPVAMAKTIQILISGAMVSTMTEDGYLSTKRAEALLVEAVLENLLA